jgi:hypothetical protein
LNKRSLRMSALSLGLVIASCSDPTPSLPENGDGGPDAALTKLDGAAGMTGGLDREKAGSSDGGMGGKGGVGGTGGVGAIGSAGAGAGGSETGGFKAGGSGGTTARGGSGGTGGTSGVGGASGSSGTSSVGGTGGTDGTSTCVCVNSGPPACTATGRVTYTLSRATSPTAQEKATYDAISCAMDMATAYYNCYTNITKSLSVSYVPSVPTADGNINGSIRFGSTGSMNCITAMHEIAHTVGIGTSSKWSSLVSNGTFTGTNATAQLRTVTGNQSDVLHADSQHFWPYGLNYTTEVSSTADLVDHCQIVVAIRRDLGM